jgi:hypothetical protein
MKLSEFYSYLTYGELANLKVGGKDVGGIYPQHADEVTSYIQQGLTDIHTRFQLKYNEVIIDLDESITMYRLTRDYAQTNTGSTQSIKYISDSVDNPFTEDVLSIEEVYDELGNELYRNNETKEASVFTPQYNILQVPEPSDETSLSIVYKADHDKLDTSSTDPENLEINVPTIFIRPLALYVGSLAQSAVGTPEANQIAFSKMQEYTALIVDITLNGVIPRKEWTNERVRINGWP